MVDNLFNLSNFDRTLATGKPVQANWSQEGFCYCGKATIVKLCRESVIVKLLSVVGANGARFVGKTLELPRFRDQTRWSSRNGIQPVDKNTLKLFY